MRNIAECYKYVIITPARNEAAYIEKTIQSVISQTILPLRWVVVSDGSTDGTDEIVNRYIGNNGWIKLLRMPEHNDRHFAAKVNCFNAGYEEVKEIDYEVIGNLDADISFEKDYFEFLMRKFAELTELGVAGTPFIEGSFQYNYRFSNIEHVSGACQLFRRKCFEEIGGYIPIKGGGIDWVAVTTARMKGWKTRTFTENICLHHRKIGAGNNNVLSANFKHGEKDYFLGNHPLWEICRNLYQMTKRPYFLGGSFLFLGYAWAALKGAERPIPAELIQYSRQEQIKRLKKAFIKNRHQKCKVTEATSMKTIGELIFESLKKVENWVEDHNFKGYEFYDGLSSFLRPLAFNNLLAERVFLQFVRLCPINIRPLIGIKPQESTKGRGYMARGYLKMLKITGNHQYKEKAVKCLEWLMESKAPGYTKYSWGNHFDFSTRGGRIPKFEPIVVWTSLIGHAFLDAYEILGDKKYLEIAISICDWILDLPREQTNSGSCVSYVAYCQSSIHNSNMLAAAMLTRTAKFSNDTAAVKIAKEAMRYSCSRQLADGAWYYGENPSYHWIDNFHTGYNLDSLKCYIDNTGDISCEENLRRGFGYFKNTFFEPNGKPKYYHNKLYPIDIQCASQAITTLSYFSEYDNSGLGLASKVANWTIDNMQDEVGYFYYRILPWIKIKTPMLHWGQATMYWGLTLLLEKIMDQKDFQSDRGKS